MSEASTETAEEAPETAAECKQVCACGKNHKNELGLEQTQAVAEAARGLAADMAAGAMPDGGKASDRIYEVMFGNGPEGMYWACVAWASMLMAVGYRPERGEGKPPPFLADSANQPESFAPEDIRYRGSEWAGRFYDAFAANEGPGATVDIFNELNDLKTGLERSEYVWPLLATTALRLQQHMVNHNPLSAVTAALARTLLGGRPGSGEVQLSIVSINLGEAPEELLRSMLGAEEQEETSDAKDSTDQDVPGPDHADRPSEPGDRGPGEESESPARP